jgi:hypothetical protein
MRSRKLRSQPRGAAKGRDGATAEVEHRRAPSASDRRVRAWALVELGDQEAIDVFVRKEDALKALEDAVNDEPEWNGSLFVAPIELDESTPSEN